MTDRDYEANEPVPLTVARTRFTKLVNLARYGGQSTTISQHGEDAARIVPPNSIVIDLDRIAERFIDRLPERLDQARIHDRATGQVETTETAAGRLLAEALDGIGEGEGADKAADWLAAHAAGLNAADHPDAAVWAQALTWAARRLRPGHRGVYALEEFTATFGDGAAAAYRTELDRLTAIRAEPEADRSGR